MMTFQDKQQALLEDLQQEYDETGPGWWKDRLLQKINDLREAMKVVS